MDSFFNGNDFYSSYDCNNTVKLILFFILNIILVVERTKSHDILGIVCPPARIYSFELIKFECFMWLISFVIFLNDHFYYI